MNGHFRHRNPNESEYEEIGPPKHRAGEYTCLQTKAFSGLTSIKLNKRIKQLFNILIAPYVSLKLQI
jgi:hypothetical protein